MIFISHKTNPDHGIALKIAEILQNNQVNCWLAPESIKPGAEWPVSITQAINCCDIFLLVLTENAALSAHVRKEVTLANNHHKPIIPIKIGDFDLDDVFQYLLADVHVIPFSFEQEKDVKNLIQRCRLGERIVEMEVGKNPIRKVTLLKGGFEENLAYFLREHPEEFNKTVFAVGIDCSSKLSISSRKGILRPLCAFLLKEYGYSIRELQKLINAAKQTQLGHKKKQEPMQFKESVLIRVPLDEGNTLKLLLVANSRKNQNYEKTQDVDEVEGIDSREIILSIFNRFSELDEELENLFVGAIGTNGLSFPYEVSISEILNCYVYAQRMMIRPENLYLSVRNEDMVRVGLTSEDILTYITTIVHFMRE